MKKTLLLTSILLGLHSAANAKNEFFVGASVNASKDRYNIDKEHGKSAKMGINSESIKYSETLKTEWETQVDQINFALDNKVQIDPYYQSLSHLQYASPISNLSYVMIINNPKLTLQEKQEKLNKLIINQNNALMLLSNNEVNPVGAELQAMLIVDTGTRPRPFHHEFVNAINTAQTVQEIETAFLGYQAAAADVLNFVAENIPPSYFENELASIYAVAGLEMLTLQEYIYAEGLLAQHQSNLPLLQAELDRLLAEKQNIIKELNSIEATASQKNTTVSLFAGFRMDLAKHFMLGFEAGTDLGKIKIGDNSKKELEITGKTGFYALTRMGVNIANFSVYGQAGLMTRKYDMSYNGTFIKQNNGGQNIVSSIYGLGIEARITDNLAVFTEYNRISSIDKSESKFIKASLKSDQIKVGSRYYFGL